MSESDLEHSYRAENLAVPRLIAQLACADIHIRIGGEDFQIPRELLNKPSDSPNYFTLDPFMIFPALTGMSSERDEGFQERPPPIVPPSLATRSASNFVDLLHILKGYKVDIRSEAHRAGLLRDARYFHLKGLEQRLIPHEITYNPIRQGSEILVRLEDIRREGLSTLEAERDPPAIPSISSQPGCTIPPAWVMYQRSHVDVEAHTLIVEIASDESARLCITPASASSQTRTGYLRLYDPALSIMNRLFELIVSKSTFDGAHVEDAAPMDVTESAYIPSSGAALKEDQVAIRIGPDADVVINGRRWTTAAIDPEVDEGSEDLDYPRSVRSLSWRSFQTTRHRESLEVMLSKSQWRVKVQASTGSPSEEKPKVEMVLCAVKIAGWSHERARNAARSFLR